MNRIIYTLRRMATAVADWNRKVFHRKGGETVWNSVFNYVHPYYPFYQEKKKKRATEVKLDEFEISAFHDGH